MIKTLYIVAVILFEVIMHSECAITTMFTKALQPCQTLMACYYVYASTESDILYMCIVTCTLNV